MYKFIIFDLDDTLYARENGLMGEVGRRIQTWLCENMELAWDDAIILRRKYYHQYGTTLGGLIEEHDVDAHDYLVYVHDILLEEYIGPNPALDAMLAAIPLRRAIYTNATADYARRVLRVLGVADHFEDVIGIDDVDLVNKPVQEAYERVLVRLETWGPECIMVEDSARNLNPAKSLGMTTVLVGGAPDWSVDFVVKDVLQVGQVVSKILKEERTLICTDKHR